MSKRKKKRRKPKNTSYSKPVKKAKPEAEIQEVSKQPQLKGKRNPIPYLLLLIIPFILYGSSISFEYVLDDKIVLSENNFVKRGVDGISDIFTTESFTGYLGSQKDLVTGARYRPLSIASFALEYEIFGLNPKVSHFLNILLYALTGMLIYIILFNLLDRKYKSWLISVPFMAALLFLLHPIHTEVVANIKSRDEILSLLFALFALHLTYKAIISKNKLYILFSAVIFFIGLMAKENAITFLAVIPLTIYVFTKTSVKRILAYSFPLLLAVVAFIMIRYEVVGYFLDSGKEVTGLMNNPFLGVEMSDKYATIVYTLGMYLKLLVFPHPLTHDYYPYQIAIMSWGQILVILSLVIYLAMIVYATVKIKKRSITAWSIITFLATLSIVSNLFFSIGTFMNERFLYMPSLAFVVLITYWIIDKLPHYVRNNRNLLNGITYGLIILLIGGYSLKTFTRVPAWETQATLNKAASTVSVNSARANQFMAYSLYLEANETSNSEEKKKLLTEATYFVDRALSIHPTYPDANNCKAGVAAGLYQLDRDLDKLLQVFYEVQMRHITPYVDAYLDYLEPRGNKAKLNQFYRKLGTDLVIAGNRPKGEFYLKRISQ